MKTKFPRRPMPAPNLLLVRPVIGLALGVSLVAILVPILALLDGASGPVGPSIPLLFLVPVLLVSAIGGRVAGIVISLLAIVVWDWFFISPLYTVSIYYPRDVLALIVFLAVALLTGQLATLVRRRAEEALRRARIAEALYRLSVTLLSHSDVTEVLAALTEQLRTTFDLTAAAVLLPRDGGWSTAAVAGKLGAELTVEASRTVAGMASWVITHGAATGLPERRLQLLPLGSESRSVGVLQLVYKENRPLDAEQELEVATFANGAAIALEQARLAHEEQAAAVARQSDALKTALLSSVSHDLRTPLAGIKAAATSLLQHDIQWSDADRDAFADDIDTEADRLTRLVGNLLDLSRIESGAIQPDCSWEDLSELIDRVARRIQKQYPEHMLMVRPQDMPAVWLDAVQIEQVVTNLVENAAKYSPAGSTVSIGIECEQTDRENLTARIVVDDQGPGIADSEQKRIFDKFYRVKSPKSRAGGTGMGLAIVRGLVEANGGRVWVDRPGGHLAGGGSRFVVELPLRSIHPGVLVPARQGRSDAE